MPNAQGMSKRQLIRERRQREQMMARLLTIGGIVVVAVVLFALMVLPLVKPVDVTPVKNPIMRANVDFNAVGDPNAPVTLTNYSDFQCPYCGLFTEETEQQLLETYVNTGKVYFVFRTFGNFIGPESQAAGESAYCAGDQGKFWEYHDLLFSNQLGENKGTFNTRKLDAIAQYLDLDMNTFHTCISEKKYADRITQDGTDGIASGVQATPSFVLSYMVNGQLQSKVIEGAVPFASFQAEIEAALAAVASGQ